ncbi:MAG: MFS transporter [Actinomycetaceae bacterium]|nr:MFS transporter [Actinomycetaceae bacterium]
MDSPNRHSAADLNFQTPEGKKSFTTAVLSIWLGTTMEYVDFALYGLAAGLVFHDVFFPHSTPIVGLLSAFATYAVGFIARPLGAIFFGRLGDKHGRKVVMVATIALMGVATTLIGFIPSYDTIGPLAPALLVLMRLGQGFGAGAELSGGAVMLAEYAPTKHRGVVASLIGVGSNTGTLLASLVWLLVLQLPMETVQAWAWRIPFIGSAIIVIGALVIRRKMKESPIYLDFQKVKEEQIRQAEESQSAEPENFFTKYKAFFWMLGLRIGENGPSYMSQTFLVGYVVTALAVSKQVPTIAVIVASLLGFIIIPGSGWISDRLGRRVTYRAYTFALMLIAFPAFWLLETRNPWIVGTVIVVAMSIASLGIFGVQAAYGVELFGIRHRYSQMALAKELGSIMSGGTAPMIAAALLAATGHWWPLALYYFVTAGIGFVTTFFAPETRGRDLALMEDADHDEAR